MLGSQETTIRAIDSNLTLNGIHLARSKPHEPFHIFFGLAERERLRGATMSFTFNATDLPASSAAHADILAPFRSRIVAQGSMTCAGGLSNFKEGMWVQAPAKTEGRDLRLPIDFQRGGVLWMRVGSNAGFHATMDSPSGRVWEASQDSTPPNLSFTLTQHLECGGPGQWSLGVPDIEGWGPQSVLFDYVAVDIPPELQGAFDCAHKATKLV